MKSIIYSFFTFLSITLLAQNPQDEIDEQIWRPFTRAWEANDGEAFNAIHSEDVWRINPGRLLVGDEYKRRNLERMQGQESQSIIEFTFDTRTANGDNAYEVGYYRITRSSGSEPAYYVGRFHVAMRKINGTWKITQDWDTGEINGVQITPESLSQREFIHFR